MPIDPVLVAYIVAISSILFAAIHDIAFRLIPNWCVLTVAVLGLALRMGEGFGAVAVGIAIVVALFAFLTFLFHLGAMGGGDVKLMSAATLLFSAREVPFLLVAISLAGGLLAVAKVGYDIVWSHRRAGRDSAANGSQTAKMPADQGADDFGLSGEGLPYGVAIFFGTLAAAAVRL